MLTTIQELEKEIEQFHKNIKDSNELINILTSVTELTKTQTESFETRTKAIIDEMSGLPPEMRNLFQSKAEEFIKEIRKENQSYQTAVSNLMDGYADKIAKAEVSVSNIPNALEEIIKKDRAANIEDLKKIQEEYSADLSKANEVFSKHLQSAVEGVQSLPEQIKEISAQQYDAFLKELGKLIDARLAQLSETESRVLDLSQQLESKYNAFVAKLEATNMDQLYKYCQDMNKSINTKLGIILGGVAVAVIISIVSLFI